MNGFLDTIKRELRFILKTPALLLLAVLAPLGYPFLYSYLYVNKYETEIPAVVVDLDRSAASRSFTQSLDATENIRIIRTVYDPAEGRNALESGKATGCIIIPERFADDLQRSSRPALRIWIDATRFMPVSDLARSLTDAVSGAAREHLLHSLEKKGIPRGSRLRYADPLTLETSVLANTAGSYGDFIIPAILLLILQQTLFAATALSAAGRGRGSAVPISIAGLSGKALPYFFLYCLYAFVFFTLHYHLWNIPFTGSVLSLVPIIAVHLLTTIFAGFFVGSFFRSPVTAMITGLFTTYPLFLMSGFAWPVSSMPPWAQVVSKLLPSTHFIAAASAAARLGAGWNEVWTESGPMLSALLVALTLSAFRMCVVKRPSPQIR